MAPDPEGRTPNLWALPAALLREVKAAMDAAGRPIPDRCYVADGPNSAIAIDGEQIVTGLGSILTASPDPLINLVGGWAVQLWADVSRKAPELEEDGAPPAGEAISASAEALAVDATALIRAVQSFTSSCRQASAVSITPLGPEGGFSRWVLLMTVPIL